MNLCLVISRYFMIKLKWKKKKRFLLLTGSKRCVVDAHSIFSNHLCRKRGSDYDFRFVFRVYSGSLCRGRVGAALSVSVRQCQPACVHQCASAGRVSEIQIQMELSWGLRGPRCCRAEPVWPLRLLRLFVCIRATAPFSGS